MISIRYRVRGGEITHNLDRYGYCKEVIREQYLHKEVVLFSRFVIWNTIIDKEYVPVYAWAGAACFGDTCGWKSKFAPFEKDGIIKYDIPKR